MMHLHRIFIFFLSLRWFTKCRKAHSVISDTRGLSNKTRTKNENYNIVKKNGIMGVFVSIVKQLSDVTQAEMFIDKATYYSFIHSFMFSHVC